jgi:hypothetical protein
MVGGAKAKYFGGLLGLTINVGDPEQGEANPDVIEEFAILARLASLLSTCSYQHE